jgi:hypothetical protein
MCVMSTTVVWAYGLSFANQKFLRKKICLKTIFVFFIVWIKIWILRLCEKIITIGFPMPRMKVGKMRRSLKKILHFEIVLDTNEKIG